MNDIKEIDELQGLLNAIRETSDVAPDFVDDLKDAAWDVLHENPGSNRRMWIETLIGEYPTEVVDALGTNPDEVMDQLAQWWRSMRYNDEITGLCYTFGEWAEVFATDQSVADYNTLVKQLCKNSY